MNFSNFFVVFNFSNFYFLFKFLKNEITALHNIGFICSVNNSSVKFYELTLTISRFTSSNIAVLFTGSFHDLRHFGATKSAKDISSQQNRRRTFRRNIIGAGQNRRRPKSAQKKKRTDFVVFGIDQKKIRVRS